MSGDNLTIALFFVATAVALISLGISQAGWKHPILIGVVFLLGILSLIIGVFWPEIKTVAPELFQSIVARIGTNPESWFFLFILILIIWIIPKHPADHRFSFGASALASSNTKEFLEKTPKDLLEFFNSHNDIQAEQLLIPFIGLWMKVEGRITFISERPSDFYLHLTTNNGDIATSDVICRGIPKREKNRLMRLEKHARIKIEGQIQRCNSVFVTLEKCNIMSTSLPALTPAIPAPQQPQSGT